MSGGGTAPGACRQEVCVTCSDTAVEVRVVELREDRLALVETGQGVEEVSVALVGPVAVGERVLVHAGEAIAVSGRSGTQR